MKLDQVITYDISNYAYDSTSMLNGPKIVLLSHNSKAYWEYKYEDSKWSMWSDERMGKGNWRQIDDDEVPGVYKYLLKTRRGTK